MNVTLYRRAANGSVLPESWEGDRLTRKDLEDVERIVVANEDDDRNPEELDIELPSVAARFANLEGAYDDYHN